MLFLLRKVRKKLMSENKFTTYFVYAIGEIILVVVGILIAVQIDHLNEARKERDRESFLMREINREMAMNLENLSISQNSIRGMLDAGEELLLLFPLTESEISSPKFAIFRDFLLTPSYDASHGTIKSIISSGDINLIQNEELRQLIVSWEDIYNDYKEEEYIAWTSGYQFMDWLSENFPNPRYVKPDYGSIDYRTLQSKIGSKIDRYIYTIEGEDVEAMKRHMNRMIELTNKN